MLNPTARRKANALFWALVVCLFLASLYWGIECVRERRHVASLAQSVVSDAGAVTPREKVVALRAYLRQHVTFHGAAYDRRPFFRASAAETLRSGKGYCGEVSRVFICMAGAVGVRAQRITLYGPHQHVVAEAELAPGEAVVVDCQEPPQIADLEPIERVMLEGDYTEYYTVNVRRLGLGGSVTRLRLAMGPLTYWLEDPNALKALLAVLLAGGLLSAKVARKGLRWFFLRRGWVHVSSLPAPQAAALRARGLPSQTV